MAAVAALPPPKPGPEPITVTVPTACAMVGIQKSQLYLLMSQGHVASVKVGGRRLVKVDSLRALVEAA